MNKQQENHLAMFQAMEKVFDKYDGTIKTVKAANDAVIQFKQNLDEIKATRLIQEGHTSGTTQQKQKEEQEMILSTLRIAGVVSIYAMDNDDLQLAEMVSVTSSELNNIGDSALLSKCTHIYNIAAGLDIAKLKYYGTTQEILNQFKKEIADFGELVAEPRNELITRSQATAKLERLFDETNDLLRDRLDKLILVLQLGDPVFYNEYKAARIIVDLKRSKKEQVEDA